LRSSFLVWKGKGKQIGQSALASSKTGGGQQITISE
jgi:hypothetical protein